MKSIRVPEGRRSVFLRDSDQESERSDAGELIVSEVIGIIKLKARGFRSVATLRGRVLHMKQLPVATDDALSGDWGAGEGAAFEPLAPASFLMKNIR